MKKFMATAFAILMFGGLSFAQSATTTTAKQNAKTEQTAKKHAADAANGTKAKAHHAYKKHAKKANAKQTKPAATTGDANQQ